MVIAPGNFSFTFRDRYSSMHNFQSLLKKSLPLSVFNQLPKFPKKKAFGVTPAFITERSLQLQQFFSSFLQSKAIMDNQEHIVLEYFMAHAADDQSKHKIEEYIYYRENKQKGGGANTT
jgi:PX domain